MTAYIELPEEYAVEGIDIGTVQLLYDNESLDAERGRVQDDGRLMVKFDRATIAGWFDGLHNEKIELTVAGEVDGTSFEGTDTIRIIAPPVPARGQWRPSTNDVLDGDVLTLMLTGNLLDGTPIVGEDVIIIIEKDKPEK